MTRFLHDQFAKQYLEELLSPLREVKTRQNIANDFTDSDPFPTNSGYSPPPHPQIY